MYVFQDEILKGKPDPHDAPDDPFECGHNELILARATCRFSRQWHGNEKAPDSKGMNR